MISLARSKTRTENKAVQLLFLSTIEGINPYCYLAIKNEKELFVVF